MHTFTYGMPPKRLPTSTIHQNAYQLQIRLPAYHMLTCLPAYHISRGHKRLPAYLLTTCPVATDHSNAQLYHIRQRVNTGPESGLYLYSYFSYSIFSSTQYSRTILLSA